MLFLGWLCLVRCTLYTYAVVGFSLNDLQDSIINAQESYVAQPAVSTHLFSLLKWLLSVIRRRLRLPRPKRQHQRAKRSSVLCAEIGAGRTCHQMSMKRLRRAGKGGPRGQQKMVFRLCTLEVWSGSMQCSLSLPASLLGCLCVAACPVEPLKAQCCRTI